MPRHTPLRARALAALFLPAFASMLVPSGATAQALAGVSVDPLTGDDARCAVSRLAPCRTLAGAHGVVAALPREGAPITITLAPGFHALDRHLVFGITTRPVHITGPGGVGAVIRIVPGVAGQTPNLTVWDGQLRNLAINGVHRRDPADPTGVVSLMGGTQMAGVTVAVTQMDGVPVVSASGGAGISQSTISAIGGPGHPALQVFDAIVDRTTISGDVTSEWDRRGASPRMSSSVIVGNLQARRGRLDLGNSVVLNTNPAQPALHVHNAPGGAPPQESTVLAVLSTVWNTSLGQCRDAVLVRGTNAPRTTATFATVASIIEAVSAQCAPFAARVSVNDCRPEPCDGSAAFTSTGPSLLWARPLPGPLDVLSRGPGGSVAGSWLISDPLFVAQPNPLSPDVRGLTPGPGSPAIDLADDAVLRAVAAGYATDVLGRPRRAGARTDAGAIEAQPLRLGPVGRLPGVPGIDIAPDGAGGLVPVAEGLDGVPAAPGGPVAGAPPTGEAAGGATATARRALTIRVRVAARTPLRGPATVRITSSGRARVSLVVRRPARGGKSRVLGVKTVRFTRASTRRVRVNLNSGVRRGPATVTAVGRWPGLLPGVDLVRTRLR